MAPSDETTHLSELCIRTARQLRRNVSARLAPAGLTFGQARALAVLAQGPNPIRMTELAERLGVVPRSATGIIEGLVESGLVSRNCDDTDRRCTLVSLSAAGERRMALLEEARAEAAQEVFGPLSATERATLAQILGSLHRADTATAGGR